MGIAGGESGAKASDTVRAGLEAWRQKLAEKGWGAPTWPVEYGGAGPILTLTSSARKFMGLVRITQFLI